MLWYNIIKLCIFVITKTTKSNTIKFDMTITFLIGNGFDINIGMATRYKDFYKYYVNLPSECDLIESLKEKYRMI